LDAPPRKMRRCGKKLQKPKIFCATELSVPPKTVHAQQLIGCHFSAGSQSASVPQKNVVHSANICHTQVSV
jgi:hypothetical protein